MFFILNRNDGDLEVFANNLVGCSFSWHIKCFFGIWGTFLRIYCRRFAFRRITRAINPFSILLIFICQ